MKRETRPTIACPACGGCGRKHLSDELWNTLKIVRNLRRTTAMEVYAKSRGTIGSTAINNRLEDLRRLGFIRRRRVGKSVFYTTLAPYQLLAETARRMK